MKAVIGLGFGDEGKGITTDFLCSNYSNPLVVRYSGGHQVGHTVNYNGKHVFSNFGSGTLRGVPTYWSKYCTIDPIGIINELNVLLKKHICPKLIIDAKCPVVTPYDIHFNRQSKETINNGSCGLGFGSTIQREENHYSLLFEDLFHPSILKLKLELIKKYYDDYGNFKEDTYTFIKCCNNIVANNIFSINYDKDLLLKSYEDIIFEGSQGLLLDKDIGFFPHVTRSNTGSKNIFKLCEYDVQPYYVTRAYQTRHGNGPMTNENIPHNIINNRNETNITNKYQGKFRKSLLDLDLLKYAIDKDCNKSKTKTLVITCLDHIENEYRFTYKGKIVYNLNETEFVKNICAILNIKNVITNNSEYSETMKYFNLKGVPKRSSEGVKV